MPVIPVLLGVSGLVKGRRFPLNEQGLRFGRDPQNEIPVDDHGVSRQHARFILHNGAAWVQDVGSRNGVFVNEMRVQAQRQLNVGDKVKIGEHILELRMEDVFENEAAADAEDAPAKRWRIWPFVVAVVVVGGVIAGIVALGGGRRSAPPPRGQDPTASLLLDAAPTLENAPPPASTGLGGVVATPKTEKPESLKIPPPPAGASSAELVEKAHGLYRAGRLHDALVAYLQAKTLDPNCEICDRRIERLQTEITEAISEHFNAGQLYYNNLQYSQAVNEWETVLLLSPDPDSAVYKETTAYLEQARAKVQAQY